MKNLQKNLVDSKKRCIFAMCLRDKHKEFFELLNKNLQTMENRQIFIALIEGKGIAVNCGENGEIGKFSIVCFDSKVLKQVAKKSEEGRYTVTFPNTEIKTTTLGTLCRWIDRTRQFSDVTTTDNALQRFATFDNELKLRVIKRCYY